MSRLRTTVNRQPRNAPRPGPEHQPQRPDPSQAPTVVPESGVKSFWYGLLAFVIDLPGPTPSRELHPLLMSGSFVHRPIIAGCRRFTSPLPSGPH
jgi:hypothetical protein